MEMVEVRRGAEDEEVEEEDDGGEADIDVGETFCS